MLKAVFYGNKFYDRSSTMFSPLYTEGGFRSDWGKISIALENGEEVSIRPAYKDEYDALKKRLDEYIDEQASDKSWANHPWVYGLGNLEKDGEGYKGSWDGKYYSQSDLDEAVRKAKDF